MNASSPLRTTAVCLLALLATGSLAGCFSGGGSDEPDLVWGRHGYSEGRFQKPRAMTADDQGRIYVVDLTARIQVFDEDGAFLRSWQTPTSEFGRPTGLSIDREGRLMVADTHYYRILFYTPEGELLPDLTIGGTYGGGPGEFGFVTDAVQDSQGNYYISEYGEYDRIQKFSPERKFVCQWGRHGGEPGQFLRPQALAVDEQDQLWVADACNHRLQIFDLRSAEGDSPPKLVRVWGEEGEAPGQMRYPYGLLLGPDDSVYIAEYGGHRIQKFKRSGEPLGVWGRPGRKPGQLYQPWALVFDTRGRLQVLDSLNHRVQRLRF
ncbi:MAG: NHL repeat-containing protein [Pirellulales bacterium]